MKIFDAYFHIIDFNYEVKENNGYIPPSYLTKDYQEETQDMNILWWCNCIRFFSRV